MKRITLLTVLACILSISSSAQIRDFKEMPDALLSNLPKMGLDHSPFLNNYESEYLNAVFKNNREGFDFTGKQIAFITGSNAGTMSNKQSYFDDERKRFEGKSSMINSKVYILNVDEKKRSGGYDAVIVYWSKVAVSHEHVIKLLSKQK
jgi:hypothetical protein